MDEKDNIKFEIESAKAQKMGRRDLIDSTFPSPAAPQPSHLGSQSTTPTKED
jgi:hypothetical protein